MPRAVLPGHPAPRVLDVLHPPPGERRRRATRAQKTPRAVPIGPRLGRHAGQGRGELPSQRVLSAPGPSPRSD